MGVWAPSTANVTGLAQPEEVHTAVITDGVLQTLDVPPALGRWLSHADQDPHGAKRIMLSYGYWQRRFGGDRSVIGRTLQLDAQTREIVGVMPRGFRLVDQNFDMFVPLAFDRNDLKLAGFGYNGIARLKPGVSLAQADAEVPRLLTIWMDSFSNGPGTNPHFYETWKITPGFRSLKQQVIGNVSSVLWVVMATVGLVMLIACVNIANLLLVRADSRQHELSIRAALGAGRARIARELLFESITLGIIGGVFALGVAYGGLRLLVAIGPANLPRLSEVVPRCALPRLHACPLSHLRIALRFFPRIQVRPHPRRCRAFRRQSHRQRRPRTSTLAQHFGRRASSDGPRPSRQRAAHDPHFCRAAQCRAQVSLILRICKQCTFSFPTFSLPTR